MNVLEMLYYSVDYLQHHKLRSFLTVLGIVVGVSSVILLVGLVQGLKQDVLKQLEDFGPRTIIIAPKTAVGGFGGGSTFVPTKGKLFEKDFERVEKYPGISSITKIISSQTTVVFKNESISASVYGIEAGVFDDTVPVEISSGRFLEDSDRGVTGLGADIADGFDEPVKTQSNMELGGRKFKVIGVLKPTGNTFAPIDNVVFIPFNDAREMFNESLLQGEISAIRLTLKEGSDVDAAAAEIEDIMRASHRVAEGDEDFRVVSPTFINRQFSGILDLLSLFLGAIASISLAVGAVGISNTMFMSVLERRREIGTMKAIGARTEQVRDLFLVESSVIGFTGGFLGIATAALIGAALSAIFAVTFVFDPLVMAGSALFSIGIGLVSGTFPAIEAAKVDPIEALRYE
ncbi:MAG: ABC transporter permease [Candidatus Micrarchaeota archaeon]